MMLVPVIWIKKGHCKDVTSSECEGGVPELFDDPVKLAQIWRIQNAKIIQIELSKSICDADLETIKEICQAVDIPVMVALPKSKEGLASELLDLGVMRVVVNKKLGGKKSSDKVCELADLRSLTLRYCCSAVELLKHKEQILSDLLHTKSSRLVLKIGFGKNHSTKTEIDGACRVLMKFLREEGCRARLSLQAPIESHVDLSDYAKLKALGVDSLVLPKSVYQNVFPCQAMWCWNQTEMVDLSKFSTAKLRSKVNPV